MASTGAGPVIGGCVGPNRVEVLRVLIVEDDAIFARLVAQIVRASGREVAGPVRSVGEALKLAELERFDLALLDVSLTDGTGLEVAEVLVPLGTRCAMLTGYHAPSDPQGVARQVEWIDKIDASKQIARLVREIGPA